MNRIVLIGNGFDLAHGMKTSYSDFLNDYWVNVIQEIRDTIKQGDKEDYENQEIKIELIKSLHLADAVVNYASLNGSLLGQGLKIVFKNKLLEIISDRRKRLVNWVDIEEEYYRLLKDLLEGKSRVYENIQELNQNLKELEIRLVAYLAGVEESFDKNAKKGDYRRLFSEIGKKIYSPFRLRDFSNFAINDLINREYKKALINRKGLEDETITHQELEEKDNMILSLISGENPKKRLRELLLSDGAENIYPLYPSSILLLNFNYTGTAYHYLNHKEFISSFQDFAPDVKPIHIHGEIYQASKNPIIFGYGDEIDKDFQKIEDLNDNDFLENIKSIKYLESDNYKQLLEFIDSGSYQIFIFGHSCGISDRTLLNTLFEHKNCESIKVFYHQKSDEENNYTDLIRNISRNFNSKTRLREIVVNHQDCEPLKKLAEAEII